MSVDLVDNVDEVASEMMMGFAVAMRRSDGRFHWRLSRVFDWDSMTVGEGTSETAEEAALLAGAAMRLAAMAEAGEHPQTSLGVAQGEGVDGVVRGLEAPATLAAFDPVHMGC